MDGVVVVTNPVGLLKSEGDDRGDGGEKWRDMERLRQGADERESWSSWMSSR